METETDGIIAVLHDVVEDTSVTLRDLQIAGYSAQIVDAVKYLTKAKEEEYEDFIERIKGNTLAIKIKIADLEDNLNFERIKEPGEDDLRRYKSTAEPLAVLRKVQFSETK